MITVRIPDDLRDRIDAVRPSTVSREAWVREACEQRLQRDTKPQNHAPWCTYDHTGPCPAENATRPEQEPKS